MFNTVLSMKIEYEIGSINWKRWDQNPSNNNLTVKFPYMMIITLVSCLLNVFFEYRARGFPYFSEILQRIAGWAIQVHLCAELLHKHPATSYLSDHSLFSLSLN